MDQRDAVRRRVREAPGGNGDGPRSHRALLACGRT